MGWLLELLLDGIREIRSQFIVDMMELVTEMFTELLSCNLSLFEELFSVVSVPKNCRAVLHPAMKELPLFQLGGMRDEVYQGNHDPGNLPDGAGVQCQCTLWNLVYVSGASCIIQI